MVALTDADRALVAQAVAKAEQITSVELRLVLAHSSSHYGAFALIYPALLALIAGGIAVAIPTDLDAQTLFFGQASVFFAAVAAMQWLPLRFALIPAAVKRKAAWRLARLHYASIGLKQPHLRNAVLVFASSVERSVEILVDDAVAEKLPEALWAPVIAEFRACFAEGRVAEAFVNAADSCAHILAQAFPPQPGQASQIPDELVEL
ncbi:MAG TPA: TPM domain-containing protein [Alphaproteobacteria bacterium]|jgi:putative membrane protein|nr:TPM domain-containing protein [Alphaproteobacteria bacterium]